MNELINWIARNNTLMIQSGFTIVLLLVVIYIYRLFFVSSEATSSALGGDVNQLSEKLEQLLQQKLSQSNSDEASGTRGGPAGGEVERLQAEIATLKGALTESEKRVVELSPNTDQGALEANTSNQELADELTKKIEILETRLAEYDIISDDIAELSRLRKENLEFRNKLGVSEAEPDAGAEPLAEAAAETDLTSEQILDEVLASSSQANEDNIYVKAPETLPDDPIGVAGSDSEPNFELDPMATTKSTKANSEPLVVGAPDANDEVSENDKTVLDDFEKVAKRGST